MSEYTIFRCDHCDGPKKKGQGKRLKPVYKKIKPDKLHSLIKKYILDFKEKNDNCIFAETVAKYFQVKTHEVTEVFKKLNQEGILSQGENRPPHDSRRAMSWIDHGNDNSWGATRYCIL